jgi:pyruvate formate lyase activating enzyme
MPQLGTLTARVREAELWERLDKRRIRCVACGHRCPIFEGQRGVCGVRFNEGGRLFAPWGYVSSLQCDPIEKKPFFHVRPGSLAMSFGMLGCDLHCGYCQNWISSQAGRDPAAGSAVRPIEAARIVSTALECGAESLISTYNEPLITAEWAVAVFKLAKAAGLLTGFVSNGNGTPEVLEYLLPCTDLFKIDLKSFEDRTYRQLGGRLQPVLDTIRRAHELGFWVEVVTLVVPGFNDSDGELRKIAQFLASVSASIPWHVSAFHDDYKMADRGSTPAATLQRALEIGRSCGLVYVYPGNVPTLGDSEHTVCPHCRLLLVERRGYRIVTNQVTQNGRCPGCNSEIAGRWNSPIGR